MSHGGVKDAPRSVEKNLFVLVVVVLVLFLILKEVAIFVKVLFVFILIVVDVILFLEFVRDGIQRNRMSLRNLQLGLALWTAEDFSFLNLVFVHVNFCGAFWAA